MGNEVTLPRLVDENGFFIHRDLATHLQTYGWVTLPINIFGVMVIVRGSSEAMSAYKWHLLNFQIWSSAFEFLMCNMITNVPINSLGNGFCYGLLINFFGGTAFHCAVSASVCLILLYCSIVQCFACRHQSLLSAGSWIKMSITSFVVVCIVFNVSALVVTSYLLYKSYRMWIEDITEHRQGDLLEDWDAIYDINIRIVNELLLYPILVIIGIGILLIFTFGTSSTFLLLSAGKNLSVKTKQLQWRFLKVLMLQTSMPLTLIVLPLAYRLWHDRMGGTSMERKMEFWGHLIWKGMHCHGLLSTLSLFLLKPYRDYVCNFLRLDKLETTDYCNTPEKRDIGIRHKIIDCINADYHYGNGKRRANFDESVNTFDGYACEVTGVFTNYGTPKSDGFFVRGEDREYGSFRIRIGSTRTPYMGDFTFFYYGGFYVTDFGAGSLSLFGRCRTKFCNSWEVDMVSRKGVKCKAHDLYFQGNAIEEQECEGQLCGIMINNIKHMKTNIYSKFCISQNSTLAEYAITAGYYMNVEVWLFNLQHFYLCDEDYCNMNIATAKKAVAKYRKARTADLQPPRNPLFIETNASDKSVIQSLICVFFAMYFSVVSNE